MMQLHQTQFKMKLVVLLALLAYGDCAKILGIFPVPAPSHYFLGNALMKGLAEKGHDVTMISPFEEKNPPKNGSYRDIFLSGVREHHLEAAKHLNFFDQDKQNPLFMISFVYKMSLNFTENALKHPNVQKLLKSKEKFDVVILEEFMNAAHKAFAIHFNAPLILLSTIGSNVWVNQLVGNPAPPSYVPDVFTAYTSQMAFSERLVNTLLYGLQMAISHWVTGPSQAKFVERYFPDAPPLQEFMYNVSLVLLNSHSSLNQPVPYVPNMIDIGGFHIRPPKKLPKELQEFLDNAKDGVIYFSMGSNIRSADLPVEKRDTFLKVFSKLKQKVLWKWEEDILPGQPPNVKLSKWLPQQDILAHPNVKLFITHGGLLSTLETVYHGMQVLAIPIGADQKLNAQKIVNDGFGLFMDFKELTEDTLSKMINELLTNPKYRENAKKRSSLFHDRLVKPMDTATYWVEYVIRHKGAPHLRVSGLDLPWYKYLLLDVIAFLSVTILCSIVLFYFVAKKILCALCGKQKRQKVKKN